MVIALLPLVAVATLLFQTPTPAPAPAAKPVAESERDAVDVAIPDIAPPAPYGSVRLAASLKARYDASIANRLRTIDDNELLDGFEHRPGKQAWVGEHVGKWLDAAVRCSVATNDVELGKKIDRVLDRLCATQEDDGYLGTYTKDKRFGLYENADWDVWVHKYCLLGLLADYRLRGNARSLMVARRIGDLLCRTFVGDASTADKEVKDIVHAGQHAGMAATSILEPMVLLYRVTAETRYLGFCHRIVQRMGEPGGPNLVNDLLAGKGVNEIGNGKAYEMLSNFVGLAEFYRQIGDKRLLQALENAWDDIVKHRLYPTGSTSAGEFFQADGVFPTGASASIAETCVTVTWLQFNLQLHRLTGETKYAEEIERTIVNHLLAAQKPSGDDWCYYTPLEGKKPYSSEMNCCHSSGPRGIALIPSFGIEATKDRVLVNWLAPESADVLVGKQKVGVTVRQEPKNFVIAVACDPATVFDLAIRIPAYAKAARVECGGMRYDAKPGETCTLHRSWNDDDVTVAVAIVPEMVDAAQYGQKGRFMLRFGSMVYAGPSDVFVPNVLQLADTKDAANPEQPHLRFLRWNTSMRRFDPWTVELMSFANAASRTDPYSVFMRRPPSPSAISLTTFAKESWSREGNVAGSIVDADETTYRVTFDGKKPATDSDFFQVTFDKPTTIARVVYCHGHSFHDGGWFDASKGKPRIEIESAEGGPFVPLGEFSTYPATTSTSNGDLTDGQAFELRMPSREVFALRVVGFPASGDDATQAFASCSEIRAFAD